MTLWWWVGNAVLILVVIPVVVLLLHRLRKAVVDVGNVVDVIHGQAGGVSGALNDVPALLKTRDLVRAARGLLVRYVGAVDRLL